MRGSDAANLEARVDAALAVVARVGELMSFHNADSELSRLNREASRRPVEVHPWTYAVLRRAMTISAASDGLFDLTIAPTLMESGLLPRSFAIPDHRGDWRHVRLLPSNRVWFEKPLLLDLGGIAKGYAVDLAFHRLRRGGCSEASVNAGGDLRVCAARAQTIHLRTAQGIVPIAELRSGAVATSSRYEQGTDAIGCIVDPRQRLPWTQLGGVTVVARSCVIADALTKVAALAGPASRRLLARFGAQAYWHCCESTA